MPNAFEVAESGTPFGPQARERRDSFCWLRRGWTRRPNALREIRGLNLSRSQSALVLGDSADLGAPKRAVGVESGQPTPKPETTDGD